MNGVDDSVYRYYGYAFLLQGGLTQATEDFVHESIEKSCPI